MTAKQHFITTQDPRRLQVWQKLFGTDTLPVFAPTPRWQPMVERRYQVVTLAYDLDLAALGETAVARYAAWKSRREGRPYGEVKAELMSAASVPIKASNCEVVVVTAEERPSPLFDLVRIVKHHLSYLGLAFPK